MALSIKTLASAVCILAALTTFPSHAATQYYCHGARGDAISGGESWDRIFIANSRQDAVNQAKEMYTPSTPGAYFKIIECSEL